MGVLDQGVAASRYRYHVVPRTLCFIIFEQDVLLLRGAADKRIWPNKYNGVGGHVERDEDLYTAAIREMQEETGLDVRDVRLRGLINVDAGAAPETDQAQPGIIVFVFSAISDSRDVVESPEGTLEWLPIEGLLSDDELTEQLVEDLPIILPRVLSMSDEDPPFFAHYTYGEHDELLVAFASPFR